MTLDVPVSARVADTERLRAPVEFSGRPDSVLVARIAVESAQVHSAERRSLEQPRLWHEGFVRPVGGRVTAAFGALRERDGVLEGRHDGVDLAGAVRPIAEEVAARLRRVLDAGTSQLPTARTATDVVPAPP